MNAPRGHRKNLTQKLSMSTISTGDAIAIFQIPFDYSMEELKAAYRRVSIAVHPDRGGTPEMFHTVNQCYQHLLHELSFRTGSASHFDMKREYEHHADMNPGMSDPSTYAAPDRQFNLTRFNEVYEKHRVDDEFRAGGYGDFLQKGVDGAPPSSLRKNENFTDAFVGRAPIENTRAIIVKPAPCLDKGSLPFTEIGLDAVDDYGAQVGDIQAFDCKQAYSEDSMARAYHNYNESSDTRRRSVEDIYTERQSYLDEVWDEEAQIQYERESRAKEAEMARRRREIMLRTDQRAYSAHAQCNRQMLGYR